MLELSVADDGGIMIFDVTDPANPEPIIPPGSVMPTVDNTTEIFIVLGEGDDVFTLVGDNRLRVEVVMNSLGPAVWLSLPIGSRCIFLVRKP